MVRPDSQRGKRTSSKAGREGRFVLAASSTLMFAIASINAAIGGTYRCPVQPQRDQDQPAGQDHADRPEHPARDHQLEGLRRLRRRGGALQPARRDLVDPEPGHRRPGKCDRRAHLRARPGDHLQLQRRGIQRLGQGRRGLPDHHHGEHQRRTLPPGQADLRPARKPPTRGSSTTAASASRRKAWRPRRAVRGQQRRDQRPSRHRGDGRRHAATIDLYGDGLVSIA